MMLFEVRLNSNEYDTSIITECENIHTAFESAYSRFRRWSNDERFTNKTVELISFNLGDYQNTYKVIFSNR